jgi:phosphoadenosine phosphosulfate reductase
MVGAHGTNLFYRSVELRRMCCDVRKSRPLARALRGYDAWITGVRRDQAATRASPEVVSVDAEHGGIAKVAPLAGWTKAQVWDYIRGHGLPYHSLYDRGYTSIGCAPCTRATSAQGGAPGTGLAGPGASRGDDPPQGEDERAGRWWWEEGGVKECGLHWTPETS